MRRASLLFKKKIDLFVEHIKPIQINASKMYYMVLNITVYT